MEEVEIWKSIKDYEGIYEVSNLGNVKRNNKLIKPIRHDKGYLKCNLYNHNFYKNPPLESEDKVNINLIDNSNSIEYRKSKFAHTLIEFNSIYSRDMLKGFYEYWTETNEGDKKFRREMQKTWSLKLRLKKWSDNNNNFKSNTNGKQSIVKSKEFKQIADAVRSDGSDR